jgi:N-acetylmuramoyl-L-alanine amidase
MWIGQFAAPFSASAEAGWQTLYANFVASQQAQVRAQRFVAFIDLEGDGVPELVQMSSVSGSSRNCRLSVYKIQSGSVVPMGVTGDVFSFPGHTFSGVRSVSFDLRATSAHKPCLSIHINSVSGKVSTLTRLAFVQSSASGRLDMVFFQSRSKRGRTNTYTVNGAAATLSQYNQANSAFTAAYARKGALPRQKLAAGFNASRIKNGVVRAASRYRTSIRASRVSLSKTKLSLPYGKTVTLKTSVAPATAIYEDYTWTSNKPGVVSVSNGVLTTENIGTATITVRTSSGAKRSCKITVTRPAAASAEITGESSTVVRGKKLTLKASVLPEKSLQTVKWSSSNPSVASVSKGVVTGKKMGTATIRAVTANGKRATYNVTVLADTLGTNSVIIDLSQWNVVTDWDALQKNVSFVILRCGVTYSQNHSRAGEMGVDSRFYGYAQQCVKRGIPFGVYYYGMASTPEIARQEAERAYEIASPYSPLFYVYDAEEEILTKASIEAFATHIRQLGARKVGCYVAHHRYASYKINTALFDFIWIPHYGANTGEVLSTPSYKCDLHQYSSNGRVPGVTGAVDLNRLMGTKPLSFFTS